MKKHLFTFILFLSMTFSFSQTYYKVADKIITEEKFHSDLEIVKKENTGKYTRIEVFEEVMRNDSLIKNFRAVVLTNEKETLISQPYLMLLNKPFPDFKFQDLKNNWYAKSRFLGKPTVVCFIHPKFLPTNKEIKRLNALNKNEQYQVVAFIVDENINKSSFNKFEFPILKQSMVWSKLNNSNIIPKYMLMDENGILTYFFPEFPNTKTTFTPINEQTQKIFNLLAN